MFITDQTAGITLALIVLGGNFIPSLIGFGRGVPHPWLLLLGNFLFGWTLVGWFAALVYAVTVHIPAAPAGKVGGEPAYYDTHDFFPKDKQRANRRREPYLALALALTLGTAHQALAQPPEWYIAVHRFTACDKISEDFTGLHTPDQVQELYERQGINFKIEHISPVVTLLTDILDDNRRIVFYVDRSICEAAIAAMHKGTAR